MRKERQAASHVKCGMMASEGAKTRCM